MRKNDYTFGEYLRYIRVVNKDTVTSLSKKLGLSHTMISRVENSKTAPLIPEQIAIVTQIYELSEAEKNKLQDLAASERGTVAKDLEMYINNNEMLRVAIRKAIDMVNDGVDTKWEKAFK